MATSIIRSSVVSTSAGRRNLCDCSLELTPSKSKSADQLTELGCSCLRCLYLGKDLGKSSEDQLPVEHKHLPLSTGSLGALSAKESPIFQRRQIWLPDPVPVTVPLSSSQFSLRSAAPAYTESQPDLDLGAVEALQLEKEMPAGNRGMDINRNNGYLHNGVSIANPSWKCY